MTDRTRGPGRTRRACLRAGGAILGAGFVAGCTGDDAEPTSTTDEQGTGEGAADPATETATSTDGDGAADSYAVTMEPVGTVEFDAVPRSIAPFTADYIDMLVALGHGDAAESIWYRERYKTTHYDELEGVSMDLSELTQLWSDGISKEPFYDMDADLHLMDPNALTDWLGAWDQSDLAEIRENVAPFLGNLIFRRTDDWHDYRYYTLYEAFEKIAAVVQERERFEAIRGMHDDVVETVRSRLPPEDERPSAALVFAGEQPDEFTPYRISGQGANKEHFHTVGLSDAFEGTGVEGYTGSETLDYETLLEIDPESLLCRYHGAGKSSEAFEASVVDYMREHELGSRLTAVQEDRVFEGGPIYTGPLHNLFMIERYAQAYYPAEFGDERLFDRDRLAQIVTEGVAE